MEYVSVRGYPLFYSLRGQPVEPERPLVVFFNGWCLSARYWEETVRALEQDYAILLFDSRGFGRSQRLGASDGYAGAIEASAWEAHQILRALELDDLPLHVVGHSLGAVVSARFAAEVAKDGRLVSLTIINSGVFEDNEAQGNSFNGFVRLFVRLKTFFDLPVVRNLIISRSVGLPIPDCYVRILTEDFRLADNKLALELALSSVEPQVLARYRADLQRLDADLLLIVGDRDSTIPPRGMYTLHKLKPDARFENFPACGHLPMLEQPDVFSQSLLEHFDQAEVTLWKGAYGS
jgi:pimeloyl-ACP methyl ester carboxylesterase